MHLTNHAKIRSQQRSIPASEMELIMNYGVPREVIGDAVAYEINGKTKNQIISRLKHLIHKVEKLPGRVVIESGDGIVITTYHKQ